MLRLSRMESGQNPPMGPPGTTISSGKTPGHREPEHAKHVSDMVALAPFTNPGSKMSYVLKSGRRSRMFRGPNGTLPPQKQREKVGPPSPVGFG